MEEQLEVTRGSGNVFADLGFPDADERKAKVCLAFQVAEIIRRRRLNQTRAGELLAIGQPKVSALMNAKLDGFSIDRLIGFLTALDRDVEVGDLAASGPSDDP
jgi:predicted XRE-type DNA-binding protein